MSADDGSTFEVLRTGANLAHTRVSLGGQTFERVMPLKDETMVVWLGHELGRLSAAPTYEAALAQLVEGQRSDEAYAG